MHAWQKNQMPVASLNQQLRISCEYLSCQLVLYSVAPIDILLINNIAFQVNKLSYLIVNCCMAKT